ncbi:MAG: hypothetical protein RR235_08250 [Oscillospiraceae bacterium]
MNDEIKDASLTYGFDAVLLDEWVRVLKTINLYVWCNGKQIPQYFNYYFVNERDWAFEIIVWSKTNAMPLFNNKYLTDKEILPIFQ